ncbi:MAG TPA: inositol monophosphatase family protein [Desulforhopalus sp.]|nr:inositol monophosphatase family protein [Desulforhopalus sp.]
MDTHPHLDDLQEMARQAGRILADGYEQQHTIAFKGKIDLVTEIDRRSEDLLLAEISRRYPGHRVLAEESGGADGGGQQWYIDPLDGTVNYAHGVPFFCVSIGYAVDGQLALGVVYEPLRDEMFVAERGKGAWLNGRRLAAAAAAELNQALLVTGFPYSVHTSANNNLPQFAGMVTRSRGVRRLGSAALDLCYVAAGRLDGYWEISLKPWDLAAGALIAEEAGAKVTTLDGAANILVEPYSILAANPLMHARMLAELQRISSETAVGHSLTRPS